MLVLNVHPVAVHSAMLCIVSCFVMFLEDAISDNIVEACSSICLVTALYVKSNGSL